MVIRRALWRAGRVSAHLATGTLIGLYLGFKAALHPRSCSAPAWLPRCVRWWHRRLVQTLDITVQRDGTLVSGCLLIGNHVSWLDIPILGAEGEITFLAKADVAAWPVIGWLARLAGTRFIARGAHQADAVAQQLTADLAAQRTVMLFPEGTTTDGRTLGRFHPRLFAIAQQPGVRVQPVAIRYRHRETLALDGDAPYTGDDSLLANLGRLIRHPGLVATVQFLEPISAAEGCSRRALAEQTRCAILTALEQWEPPHLRPHPAPVPVTDCHAPPVAGWLEPGAA